MALRQNASLYISEEACIISICINDGTIQYEDIYGQQVEVLNKEDAELFIENLTEFVAIYRKIKRNG